MTFCNLTYDKFSITFWPIKITRTWIIILHVQRKVGETRGWFKYFHLHKQTRHFLSKCMISCKGQMIRWFIVNLPVSHACVFCLKLYSRPVRCFFLYDICSAVVLSVGNYLWWQNPIILLSLPSNNNPTDDFYLYNE